MQNVVRVIMSLHALILVFFLNKNIVRYQLILFFLTNTSLNLFFVKFVKTFLPLNQR